MSKFGKRDVVDNQVGLKGTCNCGMMCAAACGCSCKNWKVKFNKRGGISNAHWPAHKFREPGPDYPAG